MRIAIGTTRPSKIAAVKEAWKVFAAELLTEKDEPVDFLTYDVSADLPAMALTVKQLMEGAEARVEALIMQLKREKAAADFYVGLEGGFHVVDAQGPRRQVFLESWAYVSDGHRGAFGHGGGVSVPAKIASPVIDRGVELGIIMDRFTGQADPQSQKGAWGVLTRDILDQKHSYVIAVLAAFAPFYNRALFD